MVKIAIKIGHGYPVVLLYVFKILQLF